MIQILKDVHVVKLVKLKKRMVRKLFEMNMVINLVNLMIKLQKMNMAK